MFNQKLLWGLFALAMFALLPAWAQADADAQPTCCAKHAYCCTVQAKCCKQAGDAAVLAVAVPSTEVAKPSCCDKHSYCCTIQAACCGKESNLDVTH